jgi:hypothetical protein
MVGDWHTVYVHQWAVRNLSKDTETQCSSYDEAAEEEALEVAKNPNDRIELLAILSD